ncbi:MAG: hypothetical protein ACXWNI_06290 [Candidatus Limnocylindrales bacterium]
MRGSGGHPPATQGPEIERLQLALGRRESRTVKSGRYESISDAEFRVFSQFGEDGIVQYLIGKVPIENDVFIEFGVEDYSESNTRFLLCNDNWRGLILDGGTSHIDFIRSRDLGWRHTIDARSIFITRDNINKTIAGAGISGDIGILSIDIDGNDYWVLEAIDVVSPRILIAEYNSTFGPDATVSVPYDPEFHRTAAHHSNLYFGASLAALCLAAGRKGLAFVGSTSAGNNAFFVRRDLLGELRELTPKEGWVDARFRESRDAKGGLTYVGGREARVALIAEMPLVDVATGALTTVGRSLAEPA